MPIWAVKALIIRYGGLRAYRKAVPFFVGLVLGGACTVILRALAASALNLRDISPYLHHMW
ncbi:MAG: hypothetical protein FJX72_02155 [Armatimonadetes bacterium]|nr:hypothetical protein [Armatimonadota bacterium]